MSRVLITRYPTPPNIEPFSDSDPMFMDFKSLDSVSIGYDLSWDSVSVYGRQDPIHSYKATGETLSFGVVYNPETGEEIGDMMEKLGQLTRPVYYNNVIQQSPLWYVKILDNVIYSKSNFIFVPFSVNVDFGDRIRSIEQTIYGKGGNFGSVELKPGNTFPKKILITFNGPIISNSPKYSTTSAGSGPNAPQADGTSRQDEAKEQGVLRPVRQDGSE